MMLWLVCNSVIAWFVDYYSYWMLLYSFSYIQLWLICSQHEITIETLYFSLTHLLVLLCTILFIKIKYCKCVLNEYLKWHIHFSGKSDNGFICTLMQLKSTDCLCPLWGHKGSWVKHNHLQLSHSKSPIQSWPAMDILESLLLE